MRPGVATGDKNDAGYFFIIPKHEAIRFIAICFSCHILSGGVCLSACSKGSRRIVVGTTGFLVVSFVAVPIVPFVPSSFPSGIRPCIQHGFG
jgi:hypothetical protein